MAARTTDTLTCPFKYDSDGDESPACEGDTCALWDLSRSECLAVVAFLNMARHTDQPKTREGCGA